MKKFLSYFFPVTKKIATEFNGVVELTYYEGKKMLNSKHTNYSYDSLQRLLKFGISKIDLTNVKTVLLLGLGGGSVIKTLIEDFRFAGTITAVELDKTIIEIAANEFQVFPDFNLEIIHGDAFEFVNTSKGTYDLILVDLFIDNLVPGIFYSTEFWESVTRIVSKSGYFIFNASVTKSANESLSDMTVVTEKSFILKRYEKVQGSNTLITGQKK